MYEELVKELREADKISMCGECGYKGDKKGPLFAKAADALEELSAFREKITDGRFYCMRDGILHELVVAQPPVGKRIQLPIGHPPKSKEET